jgi:hypothetical protein
MKKKDFTQLICNKCGWIHMGVSLSFAENEVKEFNFYYDKLKPEDQVTLYGGEKSHLSHYLFCQRCGSLFTKMRRIKKSDTVPIGCTITSILDPKKASDDK